MIPGIVSLLFGGGGAALRRTVEVFRENEEAGAVRDLARQEAALAQFAAEFAGAGRGRFDRFMDGVNRIPRPALALGTLAMFGAALFDPLWFAARMQGIALVPEPLWWLLGIIVSFYFGARHQAKEFEFQNSLAQTLARAPAIAQRISDFEAEGVRAEERNAALDEWRERG